MQKITFIATLPDILTAISLPGSDDLGARIKLDIAPRDLPAAVQLKTYGSGHQLRVTVEVLGPLITPAASLSDDGAGILED